MYVTRALAPAATGGEKKSVVASAGISGAGQGMPSQGRALLAHLVAGGRKEMSRIYSPVLRKGSTLTVLLSLGLGALTTIMMLIASLSTGMLVIIEQDLSRFWRTTYDILVRPAGTRSPIEEKYGLVEANHLSGIPGGISFAQYEEIRDIPEVEVAAPVAMLGYLMEEIPVHNFGLPSEEGLYEKVTGIIQDDGVHPPTFRPIVTGYYYITPSAQERNVPGINVNPPTGIGDYFDMPFLLAGIDPAQEAALVGLDRALVKGAFLSGEEALPIKTDVDYMGNPISRTHIPVLINATPYISLTLRTELWRVVLPAEISGLDDLAAQSPEYRRSLPRQLIAVQESNSEALYRKVVENLFHRTASFALLHESLIGIPSPIQYRELAPPFSVEEDVVLEIVLPPEAEEQPKVWTVGSLYGERPYREGSLVAVGDERARVGAFFSIYTKGVFDIEMIPRPMDVSRVPLETYFPPVSILRYDEEGHPVAPRVLRPTLNWAGYIQPPPLLLTTLQAARLLRGDDCISAIRVRVGGIDQLTPQAQSKIEAVASEIHRKTGLDVDIMVGSSPRRLLVHIPGIGYVEEQ
ncbi:MAG: hypothetical protein H5T61_16085, partial [Thermoflexales bacterium]|nr:hypothetical protein [Thermoflexales bacterium]